MRYILRCLLPCLLLIPSGCSMRVGPKIVARDRFDYTSALSTSWKEQMLLNMVKIRYADPPMFVGVAQVVATYTFEGSASVNLPDWSGAASGSAAGVSGRWAESPTITYNPIVGDTYIKSMLQPISPVVLFSLVQIGWPVDSIFAVATRAVNGLYATTNIEMVKTTGSPEFYRLLTLLRELQLTGAFALRVEPKGAAEAAVVIFRIHQIDERTEATVKEVKKLLGLNPDAHEFNLAYGTIPQNDSEIAMATRSLLEVLAEASAGVEVPAADLEQGRVLKLQEGTEVEKTDRKFHVRVHQSTSKPDPNDTYASIHYRGKWFWVDDRDLRSKRSMGFLMTLYTLLESGTAVSPPVLTISKP